jgi:hypothetical protein
MRKNDLDDDEEITVQGAVIRCGCHRKVVAVQDTTTIDRM